MTRKLTKEEHDRLGLTARQIKDLRVTDEWIEEELSRTMAPRRMSDADRAEWVREETEKRRRETYGITGGWQWGALGTTHSVMPIAQAVAWASERAGALDQDSEERAALVSLLEGVGAGTRWVEWLIATQEGVERFLDTDAPEGRPFLRLLALVPERKRGRKRKAKTPILDALRYQPEQIVEYAELERIARDLKRADPDSLKQTIRAEVESLGLPKPRFAPKPRQKSRK